MIRARSQAREAALRVLYQLDLRDDLGAGDITEQVQGGVQAPDGRRFAHELIDGCRAEAARIDAVIEETAINWKLERMAAIDRNILRLGTFELLFRPDVPVPVVINEAVDLAKKYSTKDSGSFVNGILDKVHHRHRPAKPAPASPAPASPGDGSPAS